MKQILSSYAATFTGLLYTIGFMALHYAVIARLLSILLMPLVLKITMGAYSGGEHSHTAFNIVIILLSVFLILCAVFFRVLVKQIKRLGSYKMLPLILFMTLQFLVVHVLLFFINLSSINVAAASTPGTSAGFSVSDKAIYLLCCFIFLLAGIVLDNLKETLNNKQR